MDDLGTGIGTLIGAGRTAQVFARPDGTVLKLLRPGFEMLAAAEAAGAEWLMESPIRAPRLLAQTVVDGRVGIVFERIEGPSMQDRLVDRPWELSIHATRLAQLHVQIHAVHGDGLPSQREVLRKLIDSSADFLPAGGLERVLRRLDALPDGVSVCHGDFHPNNVRLSAAGPVVVDWTAASCGDPAADIARTAFLLRHALVPRASSRLRQLTVAGALRVFLALYRAQYRRLRGISDAEVAAWWLVVLASRLGKLDPAERPLLTKLIRHELQRPE
jgi:aminoglycoside phosphotransferase (APT) family kinase protein